LGGGRGTGGRGGVIRVGGSLEVHGRTGTFKAFGGGENKFKSFMGPSVVKCDEQGAQKASWGLGGCGGGPSVDKANQMKAF